MDAVSGWAVDYDSWVKQKEGNCSIQIRANSTDEIMGKMSANFLYENSSRLLQFAEILPMYTFNNIDKVMAPVRKKIIQEFSSNLSLKTVEIFKLKSPLF